MNHKYSLKSYIGFKAVFMYDYTDGNSINRTPRPWSYLVEVA